MNEAKGGQPWPSPRSRNLISEIRRFVQAPGSTPLIKREVIARGIDTDVRRPDFRGNPGITDTDIALLQNEGEVGRFTHSEALKQLLGGLKLHVGAENVPLLDGSGVFFVINSNGETQALNISGHLQSKTSVVNEKEVLDYPGGLFDYAITKTLRAATVHSRGSNTGLKEEKDVEYLKDVVDVKGLHMGGVTYVDKDGVRWHAGVSGAELSHQALNAVNAMLPKESQDGEYTIAGAIDQAVAWFAAKIAAGETVDPAYAQGYIDGLIIELRNKAQNGPLPSHVH